MAVLEARSSQADWRRLTDGAAPLLATASIQFRTLCAYQNVQTIAPTVTSPVENGEIARTTGAG